MRGTDKLRNMAHNLIKFYFILGLRHGESLLLLSAVDDTVRVHSLSTCHRKSTSARDQLISL